MFITSEVALFVVAILNLSGANVSGNFVTIDDKTTVWVNGVCVGGIFLTVGRGLAYGYHDPKLADLQDGMLAFRNFICLTYNSLRIVDCPSHASALDVCSIIFSAMLTLRMLFAGPVVKDGYTAKYSHRANYIFMSGYLVIMGVLVGFYGSQYTCMDVTHNSVDSFSPPHSRRFGLYRGR